MQVLPIDLEAIVAIVMGVSIILIPVAGITARFALKPTVEAFARLFEHRGLEETIAILERRMSLLENRIESMDTALDRITDVVKFERELHAGSHEQERALEAGRADGGEETGMGRG